MRSRLVAIGLITLALPDDKVLAARLECLAWLVAAGRLDIKVALPTDEQGRATVQIDDRERAVLAVIGTTRFTTEPATYSYTVSTP